MKSIITILLFALTMSLSAQEIKFSNAYLLEHTDEKKVVHQGYVGANVVFNRQPPNSSTFGNPFFDYYEITNSGDTITKIRYTITKRDKEVGINLFHTIGPDGKYLIMYEHAKIGKKIKRVLLIKPNGNTIVFEKGERYRMK
ncbi:hypothetical protein [Brumimicrobium mesophilum]|uniref:hypothetical protein n=1 Tax=Brumimicrobium mesophilum TaxID=392717 RepID=UPI00131D3418|nr:hypothetical protein [Brumimicrobium mesophilum]